MRPPRVLFFFLGILIAGICHAASPTGEVYGVIRRTAGDDVAKHTHIFLDRPLLNDLDNYEVKADDGEINIHSSSPVAACRGFYDYLKGACHCQVNWSGENVKVPKILPYWRSSTSLVKFRHYYNICTFGYTTAFWDWPRWRKEVDWMALHGINMPLSLNGQDKVWRTTFRAFGVPDSSSMKFFSGPAFRPWHWMGNLNGHMGPPPESWIEGQAQLEKKILAAEKGLGMTPVVSGFSGFVPVDFGRYNPNVKLFSPTSWGGFEPTKFVDVRDPMFVAIGKRYIEEFRKEFGEVHYYLCDTFNEQNPQFPDATKLQDLAACGKAVYEAIRQGDPNGVWVMQGWLFFNEQDYWGKPEVEALLSQVPEGKMIILDLATAQFPLWQKQPAVAAKGWILNTLHNYGQNTMLEGELQGYADAVMTALNSPEKGRMLGMGLTMEGIDQNPVVYELMTDMMWAGLERPVNTQGIGGLLTPAGSVSVGDKAPVIGTPTFDASEWLNGYAYSRYGVDRPELRHAWQMLLKTVYSSGGYGAEWRKRPSYGFWSDPDKTAQIKKIVELLESQGKDLRGNALYERDLVDVTKTWLGCLADSYASAALAAWQAHDHNDKFKTRFLRLLDDIDEVMACRREHRLTTWLNQARSWGKNEKEKDFFERNARMQITLWDGKDNILDYAIKEWAGLTKDFNKRRWELLFDAMDKTPGLTSLTVQNQREWEQAWVDSTKQPEQSDAGDIVSIVEVLLMKYPETSTAEQLLNLPPEDLGIAVGKPVAVSGGTEAGTRPEVVVDGKTTGEYWAASPPPVWLQVDLEKPYQVSEIDLFCYHGDQRYYQYKLDVSLDGKTWTTVVDASKNTELSTYRGYRHKFPVVSARYVRVTMLHNSANIGQHIYELRVK